MKRILALAVFVCSLSFSLANIKVLSSVNRYSLTMDDQLQYTIKVSSSVELRITDPPAPRIDGFTFRNMYTRSSQQLTIVNFSRQAEYSKDYVYVYMPTREGQFAIPSQSLHIAGKDYRTNEIKVSVVSGGGRSSQPRSFSPFSAFPFDDTEPDMAQLGPLDDIFLLGTPASSQVYRGEPVIVSYYLYSSAPVGSFQLQTEEDFPGYGKAIYFQPDKLDFERVQHQSRSYQRALIKRISLSPQSTGSIRIPRIKGSARLYSYGYQSRSVQSRDQSIRVLPLPESGRPLGFSGAVGSYRVTESVGARQINLGDAITYNLIIEGRGNFNQFILPSMQASTNIRVASPQVVDNLNAGIDGKRTAVYTLVPRVAGTYQLPRLSFTWFDTATGGYRSFESSSQEIVVRPATVFSQFSDLISRDKATQMKDLLPRSRYRNYPLYPYSLWYWLLVLLILALVGISGFWAYEKSLKHKNPQRYSRLISERILAKHFKEAQNASQKISRDFYKLAEKGLMSFIEERYKLSNRLSTPEKLEALKEMHVSEATLQALHSFLSICQEKLFAPAEPDANSMSQDLDKLESLVRQLLREGGSK